jgi:hypothetical protein
MSILLHPFVENPPALEARPKRKPGRPKKSPPPVLLPLVYPQPRPRWTMVARVGNAQGTFTSITRYWSEGDAARCRYCPAGQCCAHEDVCTFIVHGNVANEAAWNYAPADVGGWVWDEPGGAPEPASFPRIGGGR